MQRMLDHYHTLLGSLNDAEQVLLDDFSQELVRVFWSGYKRLNWNSLGNFEMGTEPRGTPQSLSCSLF